MSNIALQPCANRAAQHHYSSTVQNLVELEGLRGLLDFPDYAALMTLSNNGQVRLWGAKPGEDGRNEARWRRIAPGDFLLFVHGAGRVSVAEVTHTFHSPDAARTLWGVTSTANGVEQTWEYMFALGNPLEMVLPTVELNRLIQRKPNAAVQEFVVLGPGQSSAVMNFLQIADSPSNPAVPDATTPRGRALSTGAQLESKFDELDETIAAVRRMEQAYLRKYILPSNSGICALCERTFPIEFLVAAHIKRRSVCADSEKRDFANVAMPNCKMGCDELFGRGLVGIDDQGVIVVSPKAPDVGPVAVYIGQHLRDRRLSFWTDRTGARSYFQYHLQNDFKN